MAPMQWVKFVISSKSCAISNHSLSVTAGGKISGCKTSQIALHVSRIMLFAVLTPTRYWYDIDTIESPDARYLKHGSVEANIRHIFVLLHIMYNKT